MIVVWSAASKCVHHLCCCCWHSFFLSVFLPFSLKYPLSICCKSGPFSLQGSLKLHLVTSTPTLTFFHFPPRRLIFLQTLPEVFLPRGSFFYSLPPSPLWCKHFVLGAEKAVQTAGEREDWWETIMSLWCRRPPQNILLSTFHLPLNFPLFVWWMQGMAFERFKVVNRVDNCKQ